MFPLPNYAKDINPLSTGNIIWCSWGLEPAIEINEYNAEISFFMNYEIFALELIENIEELFYDSCSESSTNGNMDDVTIFTRIRTVHSQG